MSATKLSSTATVSVRYPIEIVWAVGVVPAAAGSEIGASLGSGTVTKLISRSR